jgi:hypothetical protein
MVYLLNGRNSSASEPVSHQPYDGFLLIFWAENDPHPRGQDEEVAARVAADPVYQGMVPVAAMEAGQLWGSTCRFPLARGNALWTWRAANPSGYSSGRCKNPR